MKDFIESTDENIIIFYKYNVEKDQLVKLCKELKIKYELVNGETVNKYDTINNREYRILIGQINACGESVDGLQYKSHIIVYYSMPESSIEYKQSLGRIDRDGQTKVPIYYYLIMEHTIDESIYDMIKNKLEFNEEVLNKLNI